MVFVFSNAFAFFIPNHFVFEAGKNIFESVINIFEVVKNVFDYLKNRFSWNEKEK